MVSSKLADHVVLAVKDEMRSVRYRVYHGNRRSRELAGARGPMRILEPVASVAGIVMSGADAAASAYFTNSKTSLSQLEFPLAIDSYFGGSTLGVRKSFFFSAFTYGALRGLLRDFGVDAYLIYELAIYNAWETLQLRHRDLILSVTNPDSAVSTSEKDENIRRLCAATAHIVAEHRPIKQLDFDVDDPRAPKNLLISPNFYCCMVIGLATAIVSLSPGASRFTRREIIAAADAGVDARFSRLASAARGRDPVGALASEFASIAPYLS